MADPKYVVGQIVKWHGHEYVIQGVRSFYGVSWVYDFLPTSDTPVPFHFTGITELEIRPSHITKKWWKFWTTALEKEKL